MNFYLHKINPGQDSNNEFFTYKLLTKFKFLATGYSGLAKNYSVAQINNMSDSNLKSIMDVVCSSSNTNIITANNIKNFLQNMQIGDIVMVALTKIHNNKVVFCKIASDVINAVQEAKTLIKNEDVGFIRSVKILAVKEFSELSGELQNFINENKGLNTTIEINDTKIQENICKYF